MSVENVKTKINELEKTVTQLDTDVENASRDKSLSNNEKYYPVMKISFPTTAL